MANITILGSANAISGDGHENTFLAINAAGRVVLVDCGGNPVMRLQQAGIPMQRISDLVLTHFHPDHVSGGPLLLMDLWLLGRREPLTVHGLEHTLDRFEKMMALYEPWRWPDFFEVRYHRLPETERYPVIDTPELRLFSSPVRHLLPTVGLRAEFPPEQASAAYSCDTSPCEAVHRLAEGVDVLIHESAGAGLGHSSAGQAGAVALTAGARRLYLIHYPLAAHGGSAETLLAEARETFSGPVELARDFLTIVV